MVNEIKRIIDDIETKKSQCKPYVSMHLKSRDAAIDLGKIEAFDYCLSVLKQVLPNG